MAPVQVGVVSRSFPKMTVQQAAGFMAKLELKSTEFCLLHSDANYWRYNDISDMSEMTDQRFAAYVRLFQNEGISVPVLGVFTNVLCPEDEAWPAIKAYFERHMQLAAHCAIPIVATECGFRGDSRGILATRYESDFSRMVDHFQQLCALAEHYGVSVALEACVLDVVCSARRARDFVLQVNSPSMGLLLDPANLIASADEDDLFKYLSPHTLYFHGKDRKVNDAYGRIVGDGEIDWVRFLQLYHQYNEGAPFIMEYVNEENCAMVADRVREYDRLARLG